MLTRNFNIIVCRGKQYKVRADDITTVDYIPHIKIGDTISLTTIFKHHDDQSNFQSHEITGTVIDHLKDKKVPVMKFKRRKGYKIFKGHRSLKTRLHIQF